jgi:hypothetical protein
MFKTASAVAVAALVSTSAMAQVVSANLPAGQYDSTTQFTGLVDPAGLCASTVIVGSVTHGVATLGGLNHPWTQVQVQTATASPYAATTISCSFTKLPPATKFTGSGTAPGGWSALNNGTGTCTDSANGLTYTLTTSNNPNSSPKSTSTITFLPVNGKDNGARLDQSNGALAVGGSTVCFISTQTVLLRSGK